MFDVAPIILPPTMINPLISILIRTMPGRESQLSECLNSVTGQTYRNWQTFVHKDNTASPEPYYYNLFCNELKEKVKSGWFFFLDDDDYLASPDALANIATDLTDPDHPVICQFIRGDFAKPQKPYIDNKLIVSGKIGMPCLILHSKHKGLADIPAEDNGDFQWIKAVSKELHCKFVEKIVVCSPKRNYGK